MNNNASEQQKNTKTDNRAKWLIIIISAYKNLLKASK
jgi:hypothetical protein